MKIKFSQFHIISLFMSFITIFIFITIYYYNTLIDDYYYNDNSRAFKLDLFLKPTICGHIMIVWQFKTWLIVCGM